MSEKLTGPSVLALVADMNGPTYWRVLAPITALQKLGYPAGWDFKSAPLLGLAAKAADVLVLPRISWPPEHRRLAEAWFADVRRDGKTVVYETDDDVFTAAETERRIELGWADGKSRQQLDAERHERIWALRQCDGVTVTTQRLATIVRQFTDRPVIVVPNAIDLRWFQQICRETPRKVPGLTIGWAGGRRHDRDVEAMAEAWGRIARRYPDVTFVVQGHQPPIIAEHVPHERVRTIPWLRLERYPAGIAQADIGCCAVADTPFNRAKSNIKAMEYAAAGAAVVASPTLYAGLVDHGASGFIATDAGEWEDALAQLVEDRWLRQRMAKRLLKRVQRDHSLDGNLWRWPASWQQIRESARGRILKLA